MKKLSLAFATVTAMGAFAQTAAAATYLDCSVSGCRTIEDPLPNNVHESVQWDPCGGEPFSWEAHFSFEPHFDYLTIGNRRLDGWDANATGAESGPVTLLVHTDYSVLSPGLASLTVTCESRFQEAECPHHGFGDYSPTTWDPAVGNVYVRTTKAQYTGNGYLESDGPMPNPDAASGSPDEVAFHFHPADGAYKFHFRINTNGRGDRDSFYYKVNEGAWQTVNNLSALGTGWKWGSTGSIALSGGHTMITMRSREPGLSLDRVALLPANLPAPSGVGAPAVNCATKHVECEPTTCPPGATCCDNGNESFSCTSAQECPLRHTPQTPVNCDSHVDCGADALCAYVNVGGSDQMITCVPKDELFPVSPLGPTVMLPICQAGGRAPDACPAPWGACGELVNDALDIYACEF